MRCVHLTYDSNSRCLFASTNRGTIQKFDSNLKLLASSDPIYNLNSVYVIRHNDDYIYGREITGQLARWRKDTLQLDQIVDLTAWNPPDSADVPNVSHGLFLIDESIYVSMPQGGLGKFDKDLKFIGLSNYKTAALIESISVDHPEKHFAVDFSGNLYEGRIDGDMSVASRVAHGATHQILFDRRHRRYWVTDDMHCGLALFNPDSPQNFQRIFLSNDDVEWMSFNEDQSELLVACFDRYVYSIKNEPAPQISGRIGPLKYQVKQVIWAEDALAFALTEAGEIYRLNPSTLQIEEPIHKGTNAVWDLKKASDGSILAAFEDGSIKRFAVERENLHLLAEKNLGHGMIRRLAAADDKIFSLSVKGIVECLNSSLDTVWTARLQPLLRDFHLANSNLIVCGENGDLTLLEAQTGSTLWQRNFSAPLWTVTVTPDGDEFIAASRVCNRCDQDSESSGEPAKIYIGRISDGEILREIPIRGNIKKMSWLDRKTLLINGNGVIATSLVRWPEWEIEKKWADWQLNTCEAAIVLNDMVFTTTYGFQLNTYSFSGKIIESAFPFEDYATSLLPVGPKAFLAAGRGAFISLVTIDGEGAKPIRTMRFI